MAKEFFSRLPAYHWHSSVRHCGVPHANVCLLFTDVCNRLPVMHEPVHDVQVKYGSKVLNRNAISILFISREQSLITVVKMERMLQWHRIIAPLQWLCEMQVKF